MLNVIFSNIFVVVCLCFQALVTQCEANVSEHQLYCNKIADFTDFMMSLRNRLEMCSDTSGDDRAIEVQLDRLQVGHDTVSCTATVHC